MIFDGKQVLIVDIEADALLDEATKIHCLGMGYEVDGVWDIKTTTDYNDIKTLFETDCIIVGHNFQDYDLPLIKKILPDTNVKAEIWDSLFFSYALFDHRQKHGLASWGEDFGVPKPEVEDWEDQPIEVYLNRVIEDVKININMFITFFNTMIELYPDDVDTMYKHIKYINFLALKSHKQQTQVGFKVDVDKAKILLKELEEKKQKALDELISAMPKNPKKRERNKPKLKYKNDGTLRAKYEEWLTFLDACNLPEDSEGPIEYIYEYEEPNPGSPPQLKSWLFSLGWEPQEFSEGANGPVPQVRIEVDGEKTLCPSVLDLVGQEPAIMALSDLGMLTHRIGLLTGPAGFLTVANRTGGEIRQYVRALANTYRFKHGGLVNIPKQKAYSKELRACLIAPEGYKVVSGDIKSLEDTCKMLSIQPYDPDYVEELKDPSFDAHCDIAIKAGLMTEDDVSRFKLLKSEAKKRDLTVPESKDFDELSKKRQAGKKTNFTSTYKAGPKKIADTLRKPLKFGKKLHTAYWGRNWSIKSFEDSLPVTNTSDGRMWIQSNVSGFYLSLRNEKDKFSLHNQNMGRFLFDKYTAYLNYLCNLLPIYDQHDDGCFIVTDDFSEKLPDLQLKAMQMVNDEYGFSIPLQVEPAVGDRLSEV